MFQSSLSDRKLFSHV